MLYNRSNWEYDLHSITVFVLILYLFCPTMTDSTGTSERSSRIAEMELRRIKYQPSPWWRQWSHHLVCFLLFLPFFLSFVFRLLLLCTLLFFNLIYQFKKRTSGWGGVLINKRENYRAVGGFAEIGNNVGVF